MRSVERTSNNRGKSKERNQKPNQRVLRSKVSKIALRVKETREKDSAMNTYPTHGIRKDPLAEPREAVITAAADLFCIVCGGQPCFMLATAAITTLQEQFMYNEDLISTERYVQCLEKLQQCLTKHKEIAKDMLQCYSAQREALDKPREQKAEMVNLQPTLQKETRNGDP